MTDPKLTPYSEPLNPDGVWANPAAWTLALNKTVLVIDLVESVRLMDRNEADTVAQWHHLTRYVRDQVLPRCAGRLVKSLGDGLMAEFDQAQLALQAAFALHGYTTEINASRDPQDQIWLRAGLNTSDVYADDLDIYGQGVNLAARGAGLADPGQTVVTGPVRDSIVDGVDADIQDMGESHLKHWARPVRTWKVWPVSTSNAARSPAPAPDQADLRPCIAVIPFDGGQAAPQHQVVGELIADGVITHLSRNAQLRVISRMSTSAFKGRALSLDDVGTHLSAAYALSGSFSVVGDRVLIQAELADVKRREVIWADRLGGPLDDLLQMHSQLILDLTDASSQALIRATVERARVLPLPQLDSHTALMGGISLMHRSTARDLDRSRELLEAVSERHNRVATPWTWLAKWHILNVIQGRSPDAPTEFRQAIQLADRALDLEPTSSLALAIKGHVQCHLGTQLDESRQLLLQATDVNPNDHTAWMYAGFWSTMWGNPADAVRESEKALELSPLDPQRFFIEMLVAHSYFSAHELDRAIEMCKQSLKRNRYYLATLRVLMASHHESGQSQEARAVFDMLEQLQPGMTVKKFLSYGADCSPRQRVAKAMQALGSK
jgi:TolB-like protein/class 3 adenylate cyclase